MFRQSSRDVQTAGICQDFQYSVMMILYDLEGKRTLFWESKFKGINQWSITVTEMSKSFHSPEGTMAWNKQPLPSTHMLVRTHQGEKNIKGKFRLS